MTTIPTTLVDAYGHVGMPRFQTVADYQGLMARHGIGKGVLCAFDSSPDLEGIHATFSESPGDFRGIGVPLGNDRKEMEGAVVAQFRAGFSALRLTDADVSERGWLLDLIAAHQGIAVVCGKIASASVAKVLATYLTKYPQARVVGGHFAGGGSPETLEIPEVASLFGNPRFSVVFSRQGAFPEPAIQAWAREVLDRVGWERVMWGSEAPVLFWRNETMAEAICWIDVLKPTGPQRTAFLGGNASRLYFDRPIELGPLQMPFDPQTRRKVIPATMWSTALPVDQRLAGRLVHAWLRSGGEGTLGTYLEAVLERSIPGDLTTSENR